MTQIFFEPETLKSLSNEDLLKKYEQLSINIAKCHSGIFTPDMIANLETLEEAYDNEIQSRLASGQLDDDELDDLL